MHAHWVSCHQNDGYACWTSRFEKKMLNLKPHTVKKDRMPHTILRISIKGIQASQPKSFTYWGRRYSPNTDRTAGPRTAPIPKPLHLGTTNHIYSQPFPISYHIVPTIHSRWVPFNQHDGYACWISLYPKKWYRIQHHRRWKKTALHTPYSKQVKKLPTKPASQNASLTDGQLSYPNTQRTAGPRTAWTPNTLYLNTTN